jgi:phage replication initiation protein
LVICVDWLEFSVKDAAVGDVESVLGSYMVGDFVEVERGKLGYERQKVGPGGSRILSSANRPEVHAILPGDWCAALSEEQMRGLLLWVDTKGKASRCDLAGDDWQRRVGPRDVRDAVKREEAVTRTKRHRWYEELDTDIGTMYFGAPSSRQMVRVYDKGAESGGAIDAVRWELQARDETAQSLIRQLVLGRWGEVWASRLVQLVDFRDRSANSLVDRCPRMEWFEEIVGDAKKATVYEPRPVTSAEKVDSWLHRQVAPSLAAMMVRYGGDVEYVGGLMKDGKGRWKTKHRLLAKGEL